MRYGCLTPLAVITLLVVGVWLADVLLPSHARRALPGSAYDIKEYYDGYGISGDFVRILKARLPESDFIKYAEALHLSEKYDPAVHGLKYDAVKLGAGDVPDWWDEPRDMDNCYFSHTLGDEYVARVKWKNGWVYFIAQAW